MAKIKLVPKAQRGLSIKDINNIKGLNLTTISDPVTTWDIVKGNNEVNNFFNSYINSVGFNRIGGKLGIHIESFGRVH